MSADKLQKKTFMKQGDFYYKEKKYWEALIAYTRAIRLDSNDADAYVSKGNCLSELKRDEEAIVCYDQAIAFDPLNISAYNGKAHIYINLRDYDNALATFKKAIELNPKCSMLYIGKGRILRLLGQYEEGLNAFEEAFRLVSDTDYIAELCWDRYYVLCDLQRYDEALDAYDQAIQLDSQNSTYRDRISDVPEEERDLKILKCCDDGKLLSTFHRYEEALQLFDKALRIDPKYTPAYVSKGTTFLDLGRYEEALQAFNGALQVQFTDAFAHLDKGDALLKLKRYDAATRAYDRALRVFNKTLQLQPMYAFAHLGKGNALLKLNCYEEALQSYEEALRLNPKLVQAHAGKGYVLIELKRFEDALNAYEEAIDLHTDDISCYSNSGDILTDLKCYDKAQQMYEKALQLDPKLLSAYLGKGNVLFELRCYEESLIVYKQAIKIDKKNISVYLRMGDIRTILQQYEYAIDAYEIALRLAEDELNPDLIWSLAYPVQTIYRPAHIQFELFRHFLVHAPSDSRIHLAFECIRNLYDELFDVNSIPSDRLCENIQALQTLLIYLPEEERSKALSLIANGDDIRIARLLIQLAPFSLSGLTSLAHQVTLRWVPTSRNDDIVIRFYHVLDSYGVPYEDSDWLFAQELMLEGMYVQVKSVLSDLVRLRPTPDRIWLLATAMWHRKDPIQDQIEVLDQFITSTVSSDTRCGEAWKRIGELSIEIGVDAIAAIEAYKKAELYGCHVPQLQAFRFGDWDAIPGLHHHPDYAFPPVVVLDLESDYMPEAALGSRVFEIGAKRVKGKTELDVYHAIIRRDFVSPKVAERQEEAVEPEQAVQTLQRFIGTAIVVGHNLQMFDAPHLRAMGLSISDDQIIDTLTFARLLYPDSLHHHLALLCSTHKIVFKGEAHTALADAQACVDLLHALGDELIRRGEQLLAGFRAFTHPGSAFDRAVLQPRNVAADPTLHWELNPAPSMPHVLALIKGAPASPSILEALDIEKDALIERYDPNAAYVQYLPAHQRSIVTVATRSRLERILVAYQEQSDIFVLPDPRTMLCPDRLRQHIDDAENYQMKLSLFCLYQASHNHDACTLYPLRIPSDEPTLKQLRQILIESCCENNWHHSELCLKALATKAAIEKHHVLLATHESFLHQKCRPDGDVVIIDDADELQMHFADYLAERITSEQLQSWSSDVCKLLETHVSAYAKEYISNPGFREQLPFHTFVPYLMQSRDGPEKSLLTLLKEVDLVGAAIAYGLESFCQASLQEAGDSGTVHAFWLDFHFTEQQQENGLVLEKWSICGLYRDLRKAFQELFWQPYKRHILCGTAITLGALKDKFLKRFFGLPNDIEFLADERPPTKVYIPPSDVIRPSSFLGRRPWAESAGAFLYKLASSSHQSVVVMLHMSPIAEALTDAFKSQEGHLNHQVLSPHLGWPTAKIAERLVDSKRSTITIISPHLRRSILDEAVDIEATGPLRFLNQRDPLVSAQMSVFAQLYQDEGYMGAYLLPQALLELKTRTSSQANIHIILDSALRAKVYRDEVLSLFNNGEVIDILPEMSGREQAIPESFAIALSSELEHRGFHSNTAVSDEDLHLALQVLWQTNAFREFPLNQKEVVQNVLNGKDQLVVAATGGGKSLCFQLPAIFLAQDVVPKVTLVFSPLIALMQDQVKVLRDKGIFSAIVMDSTLSEPERENYLRGIRQGDYSIIYIAPEKVRASQLRRALESREIGLIVYDEAHCVSQWGHNFRTDYFALKKWIDTQICGNRERSFPLLALTATARKGYKYPANEHKEKSTVQDIIDNLGLRLTEDEVKLTSPERPELIFRVERILLPCPGCYQRLEMKKSDIRCSMCGRAFSFSRKQFKEMVRQAKVDTLVSLLTGSGDAGLRGRWEHRQRGIVYCRTVNETYNVAEDIRKSVPELRVGVYNGSMTGENRKSVYQRFMNDGEDGLDIVVATNAFGMGIDARRLGFVIHFDVPATPEAYYQEAGRAGRDPGFKALCILLYHESDLDAQHWLIRQNVVTEQQIEIVYEALCKLRGQGEQEILVTKENIAHLTGLKEDRITTIIYYLEKANGSHLLERGENATDLQQLKFEQGYQQRISNAAISVRSRQLIDVFCTSTEFGLDADCTVVIDMSELATSIPWKLSILKEEIENLVKRHIIVHASHTYVQWHKCKSDARELVAELNESIKGFLYSIEDQNDLQKRKKIYASLQRFYQQGGRTIPEEVFAQFLSNIARTSAGTLQLFEHFERLIRSRQPGYYELQLKTNAEVRKIRESIYEQLSQMVDLFAPDAVTGEWQLLDMLKEASNYEDRRYLQQLLRWLKELGLLSIADERNDFTMRIIFKQDSVPNELLKIDLSSLRLIERYAESKLELMREYATLPEEQRANLFKRYFFGEIPLIEPFVMRTDLTKQQRKIVALTEGYHLVEGPAGSGKTTMLLEHIRYLIERKLIPMDRILVATHFNTASNRISSNLASLEQDGKAISVTTLNALGEYIFKRHRQFLKSVNGQPFYADDIEPRLLRGGWLEIEKEELSLVQDVLFRFQQGEYVCEPWPPDLELPQIHQVYLLDAKKCLTAIRRFREYGIFPTCKPTSDEICLVQKPQGYNVSFYYAVYINYLLLLGEKGIYMYDDQILMALAILKTNSNIAKRYQRLYEHIIIDEFQDLTLAEAEFIGLLSSRYQNVMAFGDQVQDIRVKASRPNHEDSETDPLIETFERLSNDSPIQRHFLRTNFRSVQEILNLANDLRWNGPNKAQKAVRGLRGEKPTLIYVHTSNVLTSDMRNTDDISNDLLFAMVDAALYHRSLLPSSDTGSVAFMVAKSAWSPKVQRYLREERQCTFSVLDNAHQYQSYHVDRVLTYFRLIIDNNLDDYLERLLRRNFFLAFSSEQIGKLKETAKNNGQSLIDVVIDEEFLKQTNITEEQKGILEQHLGILYSFSSDSLFNEVWQAISELDYGPLAAVADQKREAEELEDVLRKLGDYTVKQALEYIDSHITFLEEHHAKRDLVVTTIDHAKSQAFDTVFLLGADFLTRSKRWYVSISRAKQRFYCLVKDQPQVLSSIPKEHYDELSWP